MGEPAFPGCLRVLNFDGVGVIRNHPGLFHVRGRVKSNDSVYAGLRGL